MYLPSAPNSSICAAAAAYAGPVVFPRENTKMCPFEFTATPDTSPRYKSAGSFRRFGTDSNGIAGTGCGATADEAASPNDATRYFKEASTRPSVSHLRVVIASVAATCARRAAPPSARWEALQPQRRPPVPGPFSGGHSGAPLSCFEGLFQTSAYPALLRSRPPVLP